MSTDNWEKRFDAVVKETEEKLARVKGTLSTPIKYNKYSLLDLDTSKINSFNRSINKSQDEVFRQQDEISNLKRQIKKLEDNRAKQEEETRNLRGQITTLKQNSSRTQAHIRDKLNDDNVCQFDILRKELRTELASLKSSMLKQFNIGRTGEIESIKNQCSAGCMGEIESIKKDLAQNRSNFAEEFQEMRNEMDNLRSRMMRAELELSNTTAETKELNRKLGRMDKEIVHSTETHRLQNKSTSNNIQSLSEATAYVSLMRTNIGDLQKRFCSLENDLNLKMNSLQRTVDSVPCSERGTPNVLGSRGSSYRSSEPPFSSFRDTRSVKKSSVISNLSLDLEDSIGLDDLSDNEITVSPCSLLSNSIKLSSADTLLNDDLISGIDDLTSLNNYMDDEDEDLISGMSGLLSDED